MEAAVEKLRKSIKHWQSPIVGVLGLWLAASPWALGTADQKPAMVLSVVLGLALFAAAIAMNRAGHASSGAWAGVVLGLAAAVSPWLLGPADDMNYVLSAVATGLFAAVLSCMVGFLVMDPDDWWKDRVAH